MGELTAIYDVIDDEPLLARLAQYRWTGRPGWSLRALWRACLARFVLGLGTTNALVRRLQDDEALRELCGFDDLPSRWTFGRFASRLSHHPDLVEGALAALTDRLYDLLPDFSKGLAIDASVVRSWSNPNKLSISEHEASWTAKTSNKSKRPREWFWGYKLHLVVDARHELPIAATVTTASRSDGQEMVQLFQQHMDRLGDGTVEYVTADAAYDSVAAYDFVGRYMKAAPVIPLRKLPRKRPRCRTTSGTSRQSRM